MSDWSSDVCSSDLVVIVDRHRQHALVIVLSDHIIVQHLAYLMRGRHTVARLHQRGLGLLADDIIAQLHTLVADEHRRSGDELPDLVLTLAAEGAVEGVFRIPDRKSTRLNSSH